MTSKKSNKYTFVIIFAVFIAISLISYFISRSKQNYEYPLNDYLRNNMNLEVKNEFFNKNNPLISGSNIFKI